LRGKAARESLVQMVFDVARHPLFQAEARILIDHSDLDASALNSDDIRAVADAVIELDDVLGESRLALVVSERLTFGYARMYELLADPAQIRSRVFYSREDALAWLLSPEV
jgi:hypothetical protein